MQGNDFLNFGWTTSILCLCPFKKIDELPLFIDEIIANVFILISLVILTNQGVLKLLVLTEECYSK